MKTILGLFFLLVFSPTIIYAKTENVTSSNKLLNQDKIGQPAKRNFKPKAILNTSYDDFAFSSYKNTLFNKYSGYNKLISAGLDNLGFRDFSAGFVFYAMQTKINSSNKLSANLSQNYNSIDNNGTYVHVMKQVFFPFFIDVFANYGQNKFDINSIATDGFNVINGNANYHGHNITVGARAIATYPYKSFVMQGGLTYAYNNFYQSAYNIFYSNQPVNVPQLTSRFGMLLENAYLYYNMSEHFTPFVRGGLIQLVDRSFSRPIIDASLAAPLPQLLLNRTGYSYGAGLNVNFKKLRIIPEYLHSQRGDNYRDNYVGVRFEFFLFS
ncbi:TPA: hypothetical protein JAZ42_09015 [Legionella pneumophila]|nr:autotransporter outer membrane beta-barrel domain-containing protein [Legionella pneumophila]HAT1922996.1 autotransporter outer membrane beta-barrel domain-containing protein [Legionella pneumophila]HAT7769169.1 hypothetical protein [Legionella pneumophila]HAU1683976.1 autotransporter outer membrane beta-barrel domain-containing protein [Legionella pneumophila]HAU1717448.1 autotransporter outer membrane beta-barrel domain-containing protein [Legionella pneumophila]